MSFVAIAWLFVAALAAGCVIAAAAVCGSRLLDRIGRGAVVVTAEVLDAVDEQRARRSETRR